MQDKDNERTVGDFIINLDKIIGKGMFGQVFECINTKEQNQDIDQRSLKQNDCIVPKENQYCAKVYFRYKILLKIIQKKYLISEAQQKIWIQEKQILEILMTFQHKNIVQIYYVEEQKYDSVLIMERCDGGDLQKLMDEREKNKERFTEVEAIEIVGQIIEGYKTLYQKNIVHRDIKPANILVQQDKQIGKQIYKICDFGLGKVLETMEQDILLSKVGTALYKAPQVVFNANYTTQCDIYSLGVLFYQLVFGVPPIIGNNIPDLMNNVKQYEKKSFKCPELSNVSNEVKQQIESMLEFHQQDRITWQQLFSSPLFNSGNGIGDRNNEQIVQRQQEEIIIPSPESIQKKKKKIVIISETNLNEENKTQILDLGSTLQGTQMLTQYLKVLLAKGDLALLVCKHLEQNMEQIQIDKLEQALIMTTLVGYKYFTVSNAIGLSLNSPEYICNSIKQKFKIEALEQILKRYSMCDNGEIDQIRDSIYDEYFSSSQHFNVYILVSNKNFKQQSKILFQFAKKKDRSVYIQDFMGLVRRDNNTNFEKYLLWYIYFSKYFLKNKVPYHNGSNDINYIKLVYLIHKFAEVDNEYPQDKYADIHIPEITNLNLSEQQLREYIEKKHKQ